jgi:hypothetical protein
LFIPGVAVAGALSFACLGTGEPPGDNSSLDEALGADAGACTPVIHPERELFITDLSVVKDARTKNNGAWSFQHLIDAMTPAGTNPSKFVLDWLESWPNNTLVNGFPVDQRPLVTTEIINAWPKLPDGSLDLSKAPLRLMAIVARLDLRTSCSDTGEGRFIWEFLQSNGQPFTPSFTVIFEYHLPLSQDVHQWAQDWHNLGSLNFGSAYNTALQKVTDGFTAKGAFPGRLNGSALDQLRTNEIVMDGFWELREFTLQATVGSDAGQLLESFTKQNPDQSFSFNPDAGETLAKLLEKNRAGVIAQKFIIPSSFLGGISPEAGNDRWNPPVFLPDGGFDTALRNAFAVQTCNGCHYFETGTTFLQVSGGGSLPDGGFSPAILSGFIQNTALPQRETDLKRLLCNKTCVGTSPATDPIAEPDFTPGAIE